MVGKAHEEDSHQTGDEEQDEREVPSHVLSHLADNDIRQQCRAEDVTHETGQSGSRTGHILRGQVEGLYANQHHRTIDKESDGDETADDDVHVVKIEPVDDDGDGDERHEEYCWDSTPAIEHPVGEPAAEDSAGDGSHLIGEVSPSGTLQVNTFVGEDSRSPVETAIADHIDEGVGEGDVPKETVGKNRTEDLFCREHFLGFGIVIVGSVPAPFFNRWQPA